MNEKTPPGTTPLMMEPISLFVPLAHCGGHAWHWNCRQFGCQHIGFRVVDAEKFDAWLCSQTIRPNVHHIEHEPVSSFEVEWKEKA